MTTLPTFLSNSLTPPWLTVPSSQLPVPVWQETGMKEAGPATCSHLWTRLGRLGTGTLLTDNLTYVRFLKLEYPIFTPDTSRQLKSGGGASLKREGSGLGIFRCAERSSVQNGRSLSSLLGPFVCTQIIKAWVPSKFSVGILMPCE